MKLIKTTNSLSEMIDREVEAVMNGEKDPKVQFVVRKIIEKALAKLKQLDPLLIEDIESYGGEVTVGEHTLTLCSRKTYDFSDVAQIKRLEKEIKRLKELSKAAEKGEIYDENGEQILPPTIKTTEYVKDTVRPSR